MLPKLLLTYPHKEEKWEITMALFFLRLGAIFILRKDVGLGGWSRKGQFSLTLCSKNVLT